MRGRNLLRNCARQNQITDVLAARDPHCEISLERQRVADGENEAVLQAQSVSLSEQWKLQVHNSQLTGQLVCLLLWQHAAPRERLYGGRRMA